MSDTSNQPLGLRRRALTALTVSETPSMAIEPLSTRAAARSRAGRAAARAMHRRASMSSTVAGAVDVALHDVPAEPVVSCVARSRFTAAPAAGAGEGARHVERLAMTSAREPVGARSTTVRHTPLTEIESPCAASETAFGARTVSRTPSPGGCDGR